MTDLTLSQVDGVLLLHGYRTGSNFLASVLENNNFGRPREYFNQDWQNANRGLSPGALRDSATDRILGNSSNGIFCCKLPIQDLFWLTKAIGDWSNPIDTIARQFRRCAIVVLSRRDIVMQSVSFWRAKVTGEWFRYEGAAANGPAPPCDHAGIYDAFQYLCREDHVLREALDRCEITPIRACYEEFTETPERLIAVMNEIADRLDPNRARISREFRIVSGNVVQRDAFNVIYRDEFMTGLMRSYTM